MKNENINLIKTGLYSKPASDIIESVFGQLSDGWGESSPSLDGWWKFATVGRADDGEVIIKISEEFSTQEYGYRRNPIIKNQWLNLTSVLERKAKIATWIKKTIYMEIADDIDNPDARSIIWKRDNTSFNSSYLNRDEPITIQDIYIVVEVLLEKFKSNNYSTEAVERIFGEKRSPEEALKNDR